METFPIVFMGDFRKLVGRVTIDPEEVSLPLTALCILTPLYKVTPEGNKVVLGYSMEVAE